VVAAHLCPPSTLPFRCRLGEACCPSSPPSSPPPPLTALPRVPKEEPFPCHNQHISARTGTNPATCKPPHQHRNKACLHCGRIIAANANPTSLRAYCTCRARSQIPLRPDRESSNCTKPLLIPISTVRSSCSANKDGAAGLFLFLTIHFLTSKHLPSPHSRQTSIRSLKQLTL
jgi:hypothetical protein